MTKTNAGAGAGAGEVLWRPPADAMTSVRMGRYMTWLNEHYGTRFDDFDYHALWRWSVTDLAAFWGSVAEFFEVRFHEQPTAVLGNRSMPGATWFPGATLNYAEHVLAGPEDAIVVISRSETRARQEISRGELRRQVAAVAAGLSRLGVRPGDRVVAYLPNIPEALITLLATASIGAVFTSCAPESGTRSVIDKIAQLEPSLLVTVDGYMYGGKAFERLDAVAEIRRAVPSIATTVAVSYLHADAKRIPDAVSWERLLGESAEPRYAKLPFNHPLYIVYSSGTTGKPKAIVHGHGGILLEHLKLFMLHDDLGPSDRWYWYSSTNWMAWNYGASALLPGGSLLMYDGHPTRPNLDHYWKLVGEEHVSFLGTSPALMAMCQKAGVVPRAVTDLSALRTLNSGGAPLTPDGFRWVYSSVKPDVYLSSSSGGTDVASAFVSGCRLLPVRAGEISCRLLGVDAQAFSDEGEPVVDAQGELVIRHPMPSMPVGFWGDDDGQRMIDAYFSRFPGVWCHGDWVTFSAIGTCKVTGRSDATLNRGGVRLGTSEFYSVIEQIDDVLDSLVVHLEGDDGGAGELILFVSTKDGAGLREQTRDRIRDLLCRELSPRHEPDLIQQVREIPRTLSGKRMEVPVKRVLLGYSHVSAAGAAGEGDALREFRDLAKQRRNAAGAAPASQHDS